MATKSWPSLDAALKEFPDADLTFSVNGDGSVEAELPESISLPVNAFSALVELYHGMRDAGENGTGYSPKVADAMKRLKQFQFLDLSA